MQLVSVPEAKVNLSKLLEAVIDGEEVIITESNKPIAKLSPMKTKKPIRKFGLLKGKITISPDFDSPLVITQPRLGKL